jgi:hypothetical protein
MARLVCEAFHGPAPSAAHEAAHWNGKKIDDRKDNLRWATPIENNSDKRIHGTHRFGSKAYNAKLTEALVKQAREWRSLGVPWSVVAQRCGVAVRTARNAVNGGSWTHI